MTPLDLAAAALLAVAAAEVHRVELLALLKFGPVGVHSTVARILGHAQPVWVWVDQARTRLDIQDEHAARQEAILTEACTAAEYTRRARFQQSRREDAAEDTRAGRYVPAWQRTA